MKNLRLLVGIALITGAVIMISLKLVNNKKEVEQKLYHPDVNAAVVVQADTVKRNSFVRSLHLTGTFSANHEVTISSETSGKVIKVNVEEGDYVFPAMLITQLDNDLLQAQVQSADASYKRALNTLSRYEQATSGITQLQIDNAKTDVLTSKAQLAQLTKQNSQYTITAPFGGFITKRNIELGTVVSPGSPVATLTDISALKLEVNVSEKNITQFKEKQHLTVTTDVYPDTEFEGNVIFISAKADVAHNFLVKILVPNNLITKLKAGMYGMLTLNDISSDKTITIPRSALIGSSLKPQVYVIENGKAVLRDIELGDGNESRVEAARGLKENEIVASGGLVNLFNGAKVLAGQVGN